MVQRAFRQDGCGQGHSLSSGRTCHAGAIERCHHLWSRRPPLPQCGNLAEEAEIDQTSFEFFKAACALTAYRAEKGRYPASIEELSPAYQKQLPLDRFSGKPLLYKPKADGYVIYSVGPNLKDDGGKSEEEDPQNYDIRVKAD